MTVRWNDAEIEARLRQAAMRGVVRATEAVRTEVLRLILETPKTGRLYFRRGISKVSKSGLSFSGGHRASAPGEPPASDTGTLVSRTHADFGRLAELVGVVRAGTAYAAYLEYGTQRMEPRPFMRPALAGQTDAIRRVIREEVAAEFPR